MFEEFVHKGGRVLIPSVTVSRNGTIRISPAIVEEYIKNRKHARLFFNRNRKIIGIKPVKTKISHSFSLSPVGKSAAKAIGGKSFFNHFEIPLEKTVRFEPKWSTKNKMLMIKLD